MLGVVGGAGVWAGAGAVEGAGAGALLGVPGCAGAGVVPGFGSGEVGFRGSHAERKGMVSQRSQDFEGFMRGNGR